MSVISRKSGSEANSDLDLSVSTEPVESGRPTTDPMFAGASPLRAGVLSVANHGLLQAIRVGTHLVLARLLSADAFGVMALVNSCWTGVELFSDLGIGQKIVHSKRGTERVFLDTAWTVKALRGVGLWVVMLLLGWPAARFYDVPSLGYLIPAVGLCAVLNGFTSTSVHSLERSLALERLVGLQVSAQVLSAVVTIIWAWFHPTVWSLAGGVLVSCAVQLVASHTLLGGGRRRFAYEQEAASEIFHFGKWILPSTLVYFVLTLSDRLILGKFVTPKDLGLYNIAAFVAGFVTQLLSAVSSRVLFPLFARRGEGASTAEFRHHVARVRAKILVLALPPLCGLVVWAPRVIDLLYDKRYAGAGWMTQVLAAGAIIDCIVTSSSTLLLAKGDSRRHFFTMVGGAALFGLFVACGYTLGGWQGVVVGLAAAPLARYPALAWGLWRQGVWQPMLDLAAMAGASGLVLVLHLLQAAIR